jgi:sarcosine oxidase
MTSNYDAIVLGVGGVGSAALMSLAQRGLRVLGIDRFPPAHDRGSSHGQTRIIRQAYFEHPHYVPLLLRAYDLWRELEETSGQQLLHQVGLLQVGPPSGSVVPGVLQSASLHRLAVESLTERDARNRFPAFHLPEGYAAVFEEQAGFLKVEACVRAHVEAAQRLGAELAIGEEVLSWQEQGAGISVQTTAGKRLASRVIVAPGPWAPHLLKSLKVPLEVKRKHVYWLGPSSPQLQSSQGFPTFLFELPEGVFYGFPAIDDVGLKVAEHSGGERITNPLNDLRAFDEADFRRVANFAARHIPSLGIDLRRHSVCFYTMSPDEHFLVDQLPGSDRVFFAAGLSGHGFKFTSVLGEALADLATSGRTRLPIEFLKIARFSV